MEKMRKNETLSPRKKKWKDRVLNLLMIGTVTLALGLTAAREKSAPAAQTGMTLPVEAVVTPVPSPTPHPVDAYRARRQETRTREEETLRTLAADSVSAETQAQAEAALLEMQKSRETELAVEAALSGMGYGRALCVARGENLTIILDAELTPAQAAMILALAQEASGADAENIRITAC